MHVQASDPPLCKSWRHPAGDGTHYFRNDYAEELIKAVNESGDEASLNALLLHCEPLLRSQFEYRASTKFVPIDELLSSARLKLWRSLHLFDPARGTAFSFVSRVGSSVGMSLVGERWKETDRRAELSDCAFNRLPATDDSQHGAEDIADRICKPENIPR